MKTLRALFLISAALVMTLTVAGPTKATVFTFQNDEVGFDTAVAGIAGVDAEVIDFEAFTGGDTGATLISDLTLLGVTLTPALGFGFEVSIRDIGGTSGDNTLGASGDGGTNVSALGLGEVIDFTFSEPTNAFGFFVIVGISLLADDITLSAAGTSVENPTGLAPLNCDSDSCRALFLGIVDDMATFTTASVQFGPTPGAFGTFVFELDDLKFTTPSSTPPAPVPEPGTLALFAVGLFGLGLLSRRRRKPKA